MSVKVKKTALAMLLALFTLSCQNTLNTVVNNTSLSDTQIKTFTYNIGKTGKGANLLVKVRQGTGFQTKSNIDGTLAKTTSDLKSVQIYLLKLPIGFSGTDPIGVSNANVVTGPLTVDKTGSNFNVLLTNVDGLSGGLEYYVGLRGFDGLGATGNEILKINNGSGTAWTGGTSAIAKFALSSTSVGVTTGTYAITTTTPLSITLNLANVVGAKLDTNITIIDGVVTSAAADIFSVINNFAGSSSGTSGNNGDNGQATNASLNSPSGLWIDNLGNIYISDSTNNRIRKVDSSGVITNFSGSSAGSTGNTGDNGQATGATLSSPKGIWGDNSGNIYIADSTNNRIRKVDSSGIITNFAGSSAGSSGNTGDNGQATNASLNSPSGLWIDNLGNIYISDSTNNRIRKVDSSGVITNFAGNSAGSSGNTGDNGQATNASLNAPKGIWGDNSGNIYIADSTNNRIRKVDSSGVITNFAGSSAGSSGNTGDNGQATNATLSSPKGIWGDNSGNIYIADSTNNRIRKVSATGVISNFVGSSIGTGGNIGDGGHATKSNLNNPLGLSGDNFGNIYIYDTANNRIRKVKH